MEWTSHLSIILLRSYYVTSAKNAHLHVVKKTALLLHILTLHIIMSVLNSNIAYNTNSTYNADITYNTNITCSTKHPLQ